MNCYIFGVGFDNFIYYILTECGDKEGKNTNIK